MSFGNQRQAIDADAIRAEAMLTAKIGKRDHAKVLQDILDDLEEVDFRAIAQLNDDERVSQKIQIVLTVQAVLAKALELDCGLCRNQDFVYAYNGEYWQLIDKSELEIDGLPIPQAFRIC